MNNPIRLDYKIIADIIKPGSRVLDLGCGNGELLHLLAKMKSAKVQGVELCEEAIYKCVEKGLSVFHSDIDSGLVGYPDQSFDYVILNQSMQEVIKVDYVIKEALRVGQKVIIGFPNFAYFRARLRLLFRGKAPMTPALPYSWYNTPNLHFLSISDFKDYCKAEKIKILKKYYLGRDSVVRVWPNFFALNVVFVIMK
ncbi:MAG: methionine biosynthesis protein MetW [Candidatus Omnitrophota bacterium]